MATTGTFLDVENGRRRQQQAIDQSAGAADAGKIPKLFTNGRWHLSLMPVGVAPEAKVLEATENLSAGDYVNFWNDSGTLKMRKADATVEGKEADGFVLDAIASAATGTAYQEGNNTGRSGLTPGAHYWLSTTAGQVTTTAPSGSGNVVQYLGKALTATEMTFEPDLIATIA